MLWRITHVLVMLRSSPRQRQYTCVGTSTSPSYSVRVRVTGNGHAAMVAFESKHDGFSSIFSLHEVAQWCSRREHKTYLLILERGNARRTMLAVERAACGGKVSPPATLSCLGGYIEMHPTLSQDRLRHFDPQCDTHE